MIKNHIIMDTLTINNKTYKLEEIKEEEIPIGTIINDAGFCYLRKTSENFWKSTNRDSAGRLDIAYTDETVKARVRQGFAKFVKEECEYTILSFKSDKDKVYIEEFGESGFSMFKNNREYWIEHRLNLLHWKIYSVRRESDGEIFTVGEDLSNNGEPCKLLKITIDGNNLWLHYKYYPNTKTHYTSESTNSIKDAKKFKKEKLFTTEDGVNIYENDLFYWVNPDAWKITEEKACDKRTPELIKQYSWFKFFSTAKLAEKYIENNKLAYSLNDIRKAFGDRAVIADFKLIYNLLKSKNDLR